MFQKVLSLITVFALIGIGSITLIAMVAHVSCLVETLQGGGCLAHTGDILLFNFQSRALNQLSWAVLYTLVFSVFLIVILSLDLFEGEYSECNAIQEKNGKNVFYKKFLSWFSLFELSPSSIK